jgi:SAM-dependent methyltransferase
MSQISGGFRKILSSPFVYDSFQMLVGSKKFRKAYISNYIQPTKQFRILDVGCGTGEILEFLPIPIEYHGYDLSPEYIKSARERYGNRGHWHCASVSDMQVEGYGTFDIVMANGVLHRLDDHEVVRLTEMASRALKPGGRFCSYDGCFIQGQNPLARFLISRDRGRNVREADGYKALIKPYFASVELVIRHDMLRVPYTHAIMVATKGDHA